MTATSLFLFPSPAVTEIALPAIDLGPIKLRVGQVHCVLRPKETAQVTSEDTIQISARKKLPVYTLANGDKVTITSQKKHTRPTGMDGLLLRGTDGRLSWLSHKLTDALNKEIEKTGWAGVLAKRAAQWDGVVTYKTEVQNPDGSVNEGLRPPQMGALFAIGSHWSLFNSPATIIMPTGTGKTETMLCALAAFIRTTVLVVVPSDALRSQTARKFLTFGLLRQLNVLHPDAPNPVVGVLTKVPKTTEDLEIFKRCNIVIATMDAVSDKAAQPLWEELAALVGILIIDEAHHIGAKGWNDFRNAFANKRVLQFTATPFRRDGQLVDGQVIYSYPLRMAQADGYFKPITFEPVYEASKIRADDIIAATAVATLRNDLANGFNHLMMARCDSIPRAQAVLKLYEAAAPDLNPILIHSKLPDAATRTEKLKSGRSKIAVCVNMLGEGFDLPELKVAAVHDLHKSLAILLQFTGRFTRSAGANLGNATIIANVAEPNVSVALERLYSEDADWNELLSELSSEAAQDHARLIKFLNESQRIGTDVDDDDTPISHKLLRPGVNTVVYHADKFTPKNFHQGLPAELKPYRVWLHTPSNTLFVVTRTELRVPWARSKSVKDRQWSLFVLHYDKSRKHLHLTASNTKSLYEPLAKAVGADAIINGDTIFRAMGRISRLIFQNVGVKKHGRRNLSYANYTGAEVKSALSMAEKSGSSKALLNGMGWEDGKQITLGCSSRGRIWSREQANIPRLVEWCEHIGDKLCDDTIETSKLIDHVLLPTVVTTLPEAELLGIDWPVELLRQAEERVSFIRASDEQPQTTFDLEFTSMDRAANTINFELVEAKTGLWGSFRYTLGGERTFSVVQTSDEPIDIKIGKIVNSLASYFSDYPPMFRFVDLSELDANLHVVLQNPYELDIPDERFEVRDWTGIDLKKESMWREGAIHNDSIQAYAAKLYTDGGFEVVFDDDAAGEAADLVCIKEEDDYIRVALIHCKFSGKTKPGERVKDVIEVASQAVKSARWLGKFPQLCQHMRNRNESLKVGGRPTRFLKGSTADLIRLVKLSRFKSIRPEIVIVQPGLSKENRTTEQSIVLSSALSYLKETVGIDVDIMCSD